MEHLNFSNLKTDQYNGIEFKDKTDVNGWYIVYSIVDQVTYPGHLSLNYNFSSNSGNIVLLKNDNYLENLELFVQEKGEVIQVDFRVDETYDFALIAKLDINLEILQLGSWEGSGINLNQSKFENIKGLIKQIDEYFFYEFFEGY